MVERKHFLDAWMSRWYISNFLINSHVESAVHFPLFQNCSFSLRKMANNITRKLACVCFFKSSNVCQRNLNICLNQSQSSISLTCGRFAEWRENAHSSACTGKFHRNRFIRICSSIGKALVIMLHGRTWMSSYRRIAKLQCRILKI